MKSFFGKIIAGSISGYIVLLLLLYVFQRDLLYHPHRDLLPPASYGLSMEAVRLETEDHVKITVWHAKPLAPEAPVILYFHGNAGHLGKRKKDFRAFLASGFGLLAVSYRGFGDSEGSPSQEGLYRDARAAIQYALASGVPANSIVLYGESLGTGIATKMAQEYDVRALILEAPYTSIATRGQAEYWFAPVKLLLKDNFDNLGVIASVGDPVLIMHGGKDVVVPPSDGEQVYAAAHEPKKFVMFPDNGHNNGNADEIAALVWEFAARRGNNRIVPPR